MLLLEQMYNVALQFFKNILISNLIILVDCFIFCSIIYFYFILILLLLYNFIVS